MSERLVHRGPDDSGLHIDVQQGVALAHRRLAIIDISGGHQPMSYANQKYWIVFNGEIYNFKSIRKQLEQLGHSFVSKSDTEVILAAYAQWQEQCVNHFRGMFSFALWDSQNNKLFCARDRLGIKPLYYYYDKHNFIFASELKALTVHPLIKTEICKKSLSNFFRLGYIPAPETIFRNIYKLQPAHTLIWKKNNLYIKRYWRLPDNMSTDLPSFEKASRDSYNLLDESVKVRLESDVPVGSLLSGGVDSSAVTALMSQHSLQIKTCAMGFSEALYDERKHASYIAEQFKTQHMDTTIPNDIIADLDKIIWHLDEPFADASAIPMYYLSQYASKEFKTCLSGDGGDEVYAGYNWYTSLIGANIKNNFLSHTLDKFLNTIFSTDTLYTARGSLKFRNLFSNSAHRHRNGVSQFSDKQVSRLLNLSQSELPEHPILAHHQSLPSTYDPVYRAQSVDMQTYLSEGVLMKVDKMSMAHSLEVRAPMLDHKLVELVHHLPSEYKIDKYSRKRLLKNSLVKILPDDFLNRPKQGFSTPLEHWLKHDFKELVNDHLLTPSTGSQYLNITQVQKIWRLFEKGSFTVDIANAIWCLLCFELWYEQFSQQQKVDH